MVWVCRYSAATPVVCGVAIEVPLIVLVAVSEVFHADVTLTPGANQSTQLPTFAHDGFLSDESVALTVIASVTRAGEVLQAFCANRPNTPFPAAMEYATPSAIEL